MKSLFIDSATSAAIPCVKATTFAKQLDKIWTKAKSLCPYQGTEGSDSEDL